MANVISDETIEYVGILAKLELSDNELEVILSGGQLRHLQKQLKEMEEK